MTVRVGFSIKSLVCAPPLHRRSLARATVSHRESRFYSPSTPAYKNRKPAARIIDYHNRTALEDSLIDRVDSFKKDLELKAKLNPFPMGKGLILSEIEKQITVLKDESPDEKVKSELTDVLSKLEIFKAQFQ